MSVRRAGIALFLSVLLPGLMAQSPSAPVPAGPVPLLLPPALDASGATAVFATTIAPNGKYDFFLNLYKANLPDSVVTQLKEFRGASAGGATAVSITPDAALAAYTAGEEVHLLSVATGEDRLLATNKEPCVHILMYCPACFFSCTGSPHIASDGSRVLYVSRSNNPFWVVGANGTGLSNLKVYNGTIGASSQRVLARNGTLVFTSAAPSGPTFAAAPTNVYVTGLDGSQTVALTQFGSNPAVLARDATISDDGTLVVFESNYDPAAQDKVGQSQIWMVKTDGSGLAPLTSGPDAATQPSLSADGNLLVFVRAGDIWAVAASGGEARRLTSLPHLTARDPVISGDGSRVVFLVGAENAPGAAVYTVNTDGSGLRAVYAPPAANMVRGSQRRGGRSAAGR